MIRIKFLFGLIATFIALVGTANANLIANGSFETGNLNGWTIGGTQISYQPSVVGMNVACCFGENVPASTVVGGSDEAAGAYGVYFVDDRANQFLSQSVFLTAGSYEIGFDAYAPRNGFNNPGDASFSGTIAGVTLANYTVKTQGSPQSWFNYSGLANVLTDGLYDVTFNFQTFGGASADVVIDRAYINASTNTGGTPIGVPEPASLALLAIGMLGLVGMSFRKKT